MNASSFSCPCSSQAARAAIHPYRNITPHAPVAYGARTGSLSRSPSVRTCTRCWASRPARSPRFFALLLFLFLFRERPFPLPPQQRRPQHDVTCMTSLVPAGTARGRKNLSLKRLIFVRLLTCRGRKSLSLVVNQAICPRRRMQAHTSTRRVAARTLPARTSSVRTSGARCSGTPTVTPAVRASHWPSGSPSPTDATPQLFPACSHSVPMVVLR